MSGFNEMKTSNNKMRHSNIELLRIVCILAIIVHHFAIHTEWPFDGQTISLNRVFIQSLCMGGKLGVNCFLLISGYYLVEKKRRNVSSIAKIWLTILIYSLTIPVVFMLFGVQPKSIKELAFSCAPVLRQTWKFASAYFVLMLLVPYINRLLQALSQQEYQKMLGLFFVIWCLIPTLTSQDFESNYLIWIIVMYAVGGYLKRYPSNSMDNLKITFLGAAISYLVYVSSFLVMDVLGKSIPAFANPIREIRFGQMQMIPCVALSVFLFLTFKKLKIKQSVIINRLAAATFGVFLIHDHPWVREYIWSSLLNPVKYYDSPHLIGYALFCVAVIFAACQIVEQLRLLIETQYMKPIVKMLDNAQRNMRIGDPK